MNKHLIWAALLSTVAYGCEGAMTSSPPTGGVVAIEPSISTQDIRFLGRLRRDAGLPGSHTADAGAPTPTPTDAGAPTPTPVDAGSTPTPTPVDAGSPTPTPVDAGSPTTTRDAGSPTPTVDAGSPGTCMGAGCTCVRATQMWSDDFETGDYSRWTGHSYDSGWGDSCQNNAMSTVHPHSGRYTQRSEIVCASSSPEGVHRGYGGIQWSGDSVMPDYTNSGTGMSAPNGVVNTFYTWLEPGYSFGGGRWLSLFTLNPTCGYTERVVTLGLDNPDGILRAAHYWPEGTETISPGAPAFPMGQWVRVTIYLNLETGVMHVWQNGQSVSHITGIVRATTTLCQFHWGLYASGDNTDIVLYEDDNVIWRMDQPLTDFSREPWLGETQAVCP